MVPLTHRAVHISFLMPFLRSSTSTGFLSLTTGFFRPQFFYRHGFTVEGRYAGLVRPLVDEKAEAD